jgi:hypothetical protein
MWVFRRTLARVARLKRDPDELAYRERSRSASLEIDDITAREWLLRNRSSLHILRLGDPTGPQRSALAEISAWQLSMQRKD